jgi:hypothetical protein
MSFWLDRISRCEERTSVAVSVTSRRAFVTELVTGKVSRLPSPFASRRRQRDDFAESFAPRH